MSRVAVHPFRAAVEARDIETAIALLAPDVRFRSPVVFEEYVGREVVGHLLRAVFATFEDFHYVTEVATGADHVLVFHARVGDRELDGVDVVHDDEDGLIDDFMVMVRPLSGAHALRDAMAARLASG